MVFGGEDPVGQLPGPYGLVPEETRHDIPPPH